MRRSAGETCRPCRWILLPCRLVRWICSTSGWPGREGAARISIDAVILGGGRAERGSGFGAEKIGSGTRAEGIGGSGLAEEATCSIRIGGAEGVGGAIVTSKQATSTG